jgi:hypothetical protein
MRWPEPDANPFPAPHRREPANLRRDIVDELADHLALAAEEEIEKRGRAEDEAWAVARTRFGNPDAVARRLWWDAMKEGIMREWIQTGIAAVSALVVVLASVFLIQNIRQMQTMQATQAELLKAVQGLGAAGQPKEPDGLPLEIEVRRGTPEGPSAEGLRVELSGKINGESQARASLDTDAKGCVRFFPVPQGVYGIKIQDPRSTMELSLTHSLFAGVGSTKLILAPDYEAVETRFVVKPDLPFWDKRMLVLTNFTVQDEIGGFKWIRSERFLAGPTSIYVLASTTRSQSPPINLGPSDRRVNEIGQASSSMRIPPLNVVFRDVKTAYLFDPPETRQEFSLASAVAGTDVSADLRKNEINTVVLELTEDQVRQVERAMQGYTVASRWMRQDVGYIRLDIREEIDDMSLGSYVVDSRPIGEFIVAACVANAEPNTMTGETQMTMEVREKLPESPSAPRPVRPVRPLDSTANAVPVDDTVSANNATCMGDYVVLRLPDSATLASSYPENCRFLLACYAGESINTVTPWHGQAWSSAAGERFDVVKWGDVRDLKLREDCAVQAKLADITDQVRGSGGIAPPDGYLVPVPEGEQVFLDMNDAARAWLLPHIVAVSDTPPEDL